MPVACQQGFCCIKAMLTFHSSWRLCKESRSQSHWQTISGETRHPRGGEADQEGHRFFPHYRTQIELPLPVAVSLLPSQRLAADHPSRQSESCTSFRVRRTTLSSLHGPRRLRHQISLNSSSEPHLDLEIHAIWTTHDSIQLAAA